MFNTSQETSLESWAAICLASAQFKREIDEVVAYFTIGNINGSDVFLTPTNAMSTTFDEEVKTIYVQIKPTTSRRGMFSPYSSN